MSNESLSSYIDRLMQLELERKENSEMIKDLKTEAKGSGFDAEALAEVVRRKMWDEKKKAKAKEKAILLLSRDSFSIVSITLNRILKFSYYIKFF